MKLFQTMLCALAAVGLSGQAQGEDATKGAYVLDVTMKNILGEDVNLEEAYRGRVMLIVNVASKCGLTPQYEQLVALHKEYVEQGLSVVGFPANNFGQQEPGTNAEIREFCKASYEVEFDLMAKVSVKGDDICPLYKELTSAETNPGFEGEIEWNFAKFLVNRDGHVVARFDPKTKPDAPEVIEAVERELAKKPEAVAKAEG